MIKVKCFTNLDGFEKVNWPRRFACRPQLGDYVNDYNDSKKLRIVAITHRINSNDEPYLKIKLHK